MLIAVAKGDNDTKIVLLGVSRGNIDRLTAGKPIRVTAETHPGFPPDIVIGMIYGETESALADIMKGSIGDQTKINISPDADPDVAQQIVKGVALGATGRFPYGKQDATDEGELAAGIAADPQNGSVRINFGKPVAWLSLPATAAREFAALLVSKADELERRMS